MFAGPTLVTGGNFHNLNTDNSFEEKDREGIKLLRRKVAPGAFHNSAERFDPPKCHPGTREAVIKEIMDWIETVDKEEFFLWLYGPAGAGKSAIAQTIAELCYEAGHLAASFFFSRTAARRNDSTLLIPTLTYQLIKAIPELRKHVCLVLETDPLIFSLSLQAQLEALIAKPLLKLPSYPNLPNTKPKSYPQLIIIDGLDECMGSDTQRYIVTALSSVVQRHHLPLFFIIASRPEPEIRDIFNEDSMTMLTRQLALDDNYKPDADIKIFLTASFEKIKQRHPLGPCLSIEWPSGSDLDYLIRKSSGQFIYASTVMKFIASPRHRPTERLDIILGLKPPGKQTPFAELDTLYTFIFTVVDNIEAVLDVFMFLLLFHDGSRAVASIVESFWFYNPGDLQTILVDMHSIVFVPPPDSDEDMLRIFHASLGDYLMDRSRSGNFFVDPAKAHTRMAQHCIKHISATISRDLRLMSMNDHDYLNTLLSAKCFMVECTKSYPTAELLEELNTFRFDHCLKLAAVSSYGTWGGVMTTVPDFFDWLQQCSRAHNLEHLCSHYMKQLDLCLRDVTWDIMCASPDSQHLLTALTLSCWDSNVRINKIFNMNRDFFISPRGVQPAREAIFDFILKFPRYHSLWVAFLCDPIRSGKHYRDKSKYIDLAAKTLTCLGKPKATSHLDSWDRQGADAYNLKITLNILLRFPRNHELVKLLRANPLRPDVGTVEFADFPREEAKSKIESYIKDCESNTPDAFAAAKPKRSKMRWLKTLFK